MRIDGMPDFPRDSTLAASDVITQHRWSWLCPPQVRLWVWSVRPARVSRTCCGYWRATYPRHPMTCNSHA